MIYNQNNMRLFETIIKYTVAALCLTAQNLCFAAQGASPPMSDFTPVFGAVDVSEENSTCVIMSNGGDNQNRSYRVTATENGSGAFELTNGSETVPVHLYWRDDDFSAVELTDGAQNSSIRTGNTTSQCGGGSPNLSYLEVRFLLSDYEVTYAPADTYSADIDLFYERTGGGGSDFTDVINIALDIQPLTRISGLSDVTLDYTGWTPGSNITKVQSLCLYTNDNANEVYITPSSTTLHNGNANLFGVEEPGGRTRRYNLRFREPGTGWGVLGGNPDNGELVGPIDTAGASIDCSNNGENLQMRVRISGGQANGAGEGVHTGVLNLTVTVP